MGFLAKLADRMILDASTDPIDPESRVRREISWGAQSCEAWILRREVPGADRKWFVLKFPGTGGRAERGGPHPCELFDNISAEVWTINPPGYGTSGGRASMESLAQSATRAWEEINNVAGDAPILVTGNSLGCLSAIFVAANFQPCGLFLRNPLPLVELINGRYSWWNAGLLARLISNQVPSSLNAIANARKCSAPAYVVMSMKDRVVPVRYQEMITDAYAGPTRIFQVPGADHHHPIPDSLSADYIQSVGWLQHQMNIENP